MRNVYYLVMIGALTCLTDCAMSEISVPEHCQLRAAIQKFLVSLDEHITDKSPISLTGNDTSVEKKIARETAKAVRVDVYNKYQGYKKQEKNFVSLAACIQQVHKSIEKQREIAGFSDLRDEQFAIWKDMRTGLIHLKKILDTMKQ